jgi:hypothetical protein
LFFPWQYFLPLSFLFLIRDQKTKSFGYYLLTITITFLLTISSSATKLIWYVLPVIPLLSLAIGFGLERLYCGLVNLQGRIVPGFRLLLLALFAVAVFAFPYIEILQKVYHPEPSAEERERVSYRDFFRQLPAGRSYTMVLPGYNGHFSFYQQYFNQKGNKIGSVYLNPPDEQVQFSADTTTWFLPGASIGVCEGKAKAFMDNHYLTDTLQSWENCKLLRIKERKPQ